MDLSNPMHAGQWDPDKLPATGGTDDYFIDLHRYLFPQSPLRVEYRGYFDEMKG